jgi:UDP-2,4-diacetamido-2,4,6-trideoxy-beta-L-altropyranose hydrolase
MLRVGIRVDASRVLSLGHLTRCLTLADALKARGADVVFLSAPSTAAWRTMIEGRGHEVRILALHALSEAGPLHRASRGPPPPLRGGGEEPSFPPLRSEAKRGRGTARSAVEGAAERDDNLPWGWRTDAEATFAALSEPLDWLIVDHYALDARWERAVRAAAVKIMVVDDLADRPHDCDLLLDQNAQDDSKDRYSGLLPPNARRLIGPHYALLRPQFSAARRRARDGSVKRVLVFMSATDPRGATLLALDALSLGRLAALPVDVVIGAGSPHLKAVEARAAARGRTTLHVDTDKMAALCAAADLAIGAGGVAALERCCVGLPSLVLSIAANQEPGLAALEAVGAVRLLGPVEGWTASALASEIETLIDDRRALLSLAERAAALVDGRGAARCAAAVAGFSVALRKATFDDARCLLDWRNGDSVRLVSLNSAPIARADHLAWLRRKLADPDHAHWIGDSEGEACGSVRFDIADGKARVSITVAPGRRGGGLGAHLLAEGERRLLAERNDVVEFVAEILPDNAPSRRLFEKAGYRLGGAADANPLLYVKFARPDGA